MAIKSSACKDVGSSQDGGWDAWGEIKYVGERLSMLSSVQIVIYVIDVQVSLSTTRNLILHVWFYEGLHILGLTITYAEV